MKLTDPGKNLPTRQERKSARKAAWTRPATALQKKNAKEERQADWESQNGMVKK